jgi:hypothetical protein
VAVRPQMSVFYFVDAVGEESGGNARDLVKTNATRKSHRIFLLDLGIVPPTETAQNAERGLFFEAVLVCPILLSQILQLRRARSMSQKKLKNHFADFIYLLRPDFDDQILFNRIKAGSDTSIINS